MHGHEFKSWEAAPQGVSPVSKENTLMRPWRHSSRSSWVEVGPIVQIAAIDSTTVRYHGFFHSARSRSDGQLDDGAH